MEPKIKTQSDTIKVTWILDCLALSHCPGKNIAKGRDGKTHKRNIKKDVQSYKTQGIDQIVCLLNDYEMRSIGVDVKSYVAACQSSEITFIQYPIIEMSIPEDDALFQELVINNIVQDKKTLVHCRGGIGRAGTVASIACMIYLKLTPKQAITYVRKKRDKRCVESRKQEDYIKSYFTKYLQN